MQRDGIDEGFADWVKGEDDGVWGINYPGNDQPKQHNSCDCGVFCMLTCLFLSMNRAFTFDQDSMDSWRELIAMDLLHKEARHTRRAAALTPE